MKNKSVVMKILIGGSFVLFLLLLVVIFSLIKMILPKENKVKVDEKKVINENYPLEGIEKITFDLKKSNAIIKPGEGEELIIVQNSKEKKFFLNHKEKKNELSFVEDSYIINPQKKKYTIYIPKNYLYEINIINGFGKIDISDINNEIAINNNSGSIILNQIGNSKIKDVSGNIYYGNIVGNIEVETSTGNITVENITGSINAETITGDILVTNYNITGNSNFENVSGGIVLKMSENSICSLAYSNETGKTTIDENICTGLTNLINIKNMTGIIKIY